MKTLVSVALAGALAASALATSMTTAGAGWDGSRQWDGDWQGRRHWDHHDRGWNPGAAAFAGLALGLTMGALAPPQPYYGPYYAYPDYPPPPPPAYAYPVRGWSDAHINWCASTYNTYNPETDYWYDYNRVPHRCVGPY